MGIEKWNEALMNVTWRDIKKYMNIVNDLYSVNVSQDREFQKRYNGFYKVRQKKKEFYDVYYKIMEKGKGKDITFEEVLLELYNELGSVEASFSSKLISTLDCKYPIWDSYVLKNLNIKAPRCGCKDRLRKTIETYNILCQWYDEFLICNEGIDIINKFNSMYPCDISNTKKIDFLLWNIRQ